MKRLFIALTMLVISFASFAGENVASTVHDDFTTSVSTLYNDGKAAVTTVYNDSKDLLGIAYPEVKAAVISIAQAIGCAAEHVYIVLVKKYVVDGVKELFVFLIGLALLIIGWLKLDKYIKFLNSQPKEERGVRWPILYPILIAIAGVVCVSVVNYNTMFMGLINPEYGAIDYILQFTKTLAH